MKYLIIVALALVVLATSCGRNTEESLYIVLKQHEQQRKVSNDQN